MPICHSKTSLFKYVCFGIHTHVLLRLFQIQTFLYPSQLHDLSKDGAVLAHPPWGADGGQDVSWFWRGSHWKRIKSYVQICIFLHKTNTWSLIFHAGCPITLKLLLRAVWARPHLEPSLPEITVEILQLKCRSEDRALQGAVSDWDNSLDHGWFTSRRTCWWKTWRSTAWKWPGSRPWRRSTWTNSPRICSLCNSSCNPFPPTVWSRWVCRRWMLVLQACRICPSYPSTARHTHTPV